MPGSPGMPQNIGFSAPVLVDVTPRGLVVETAGGYTDTIIPRNSKIPCERTRRFATGRDMQTTVRVRVGQGESPQFPQNTFLGEVELSGLRPAPRGEVTVAVTFEVDADGTLRIRARDVQTGQEARATLQLIGVADESSVVMMINRFAQQPVVGDRDTARSDALNAVDGRRLDQAVARRRSIRSRTTISSASARDATPTRCATPSTRSPRTFHPDVHHWRHPNEQAAIGYIFKRGTEAYRVLSDPQLRVRYDEALANGILRPEQLVVEIGRPALAVDGPRRSAARGNRLSRQGANAGRAPVRAARRGARQEGRPAAGQAAARHGDAHGSEESCPRGLRKRARRGDQGEGRRSEEELEEVTDWRVTSCTMVVWAAT